MHVGLGLCYPKGRWLDALAGLSSAEDETRERWGLAARKTDLFEPVPVVTA